MPLTSAHLFLADKLGPDSPNDPNLFTADEIGAYLGIGSSSSAAASTADSKAVSAGSQASVADSKAVSDSVNISVADSKAVSDSGNNSSTADSKAVSAGTQASVADSKAVSDSVNISVADSKGVSAGAGGSSASAADSKAVSAASQASIADSKGVSGSIIASTNLSTSDSKNTSQSSLISIADSKGASASALPRSKSVFIESPTGAEKTMLFYTTVAITVAQIEAVLFGSSSPSVTFSIRYGADVSGSGTEVKTSGITVTSTTIGSNTSSFDSAAIPANNFVWITTSAQSGTVTGLSVTVLY